MARKKEESRPVEEVLHESEMDSLLGERFAIYAKDVIQNRAIPDARDGLKPVQRRILYGMWVAGNTHDRPTKKCAHIVGDVMGKYHPHGDSSIYEALVRLSQPWNTRAPLVDFQGNNGSIDGDSPAAYRYTEARLSALSEEMLEDLENDTVDMALTFDDTLEEPTVLPAHFPNLLLNGAEGIAVGIATNIPPHNLRELVEAICHRIEHPDCPGEELADLLGGPDFPTGGILYKGEGVREMYLTGRGRFLIEAKAHREEEKGHALLVVDEIPYQVNKGQLVKSLDKIRHDKELPGIEEVRDESDRDGLRIVVELKSGTNEEAVRNYLFQKTQLRISYSAHMVAIVEGSPRTLSLQEYCDSYIQHALEIVARRSRHLLEKDKARLLIVEGLLRVAEDRALLDQVVETIKRSKDKAEAKENLVREFSFVPEQAEAILMMPLHRLTHGDVVLLSKEGEALRKEIRELESLLQSQKRRESLIAKGLRQIADKYGDERRTELRDGEPGKLSIDRRDLIQSEECYLVCTRHGYLKRSSLMSYQKSKGHEGVRPGIKSEDTFLYLGRCTTKDFLLLFTDRGRYLQIPVSEIRSAKWNEEGFHVSSLVQLQDGERLVGAFALSRFREDVPVLMLTRNGTIKRSLLSEFPLQRWSRPGQAISFGRQEQDRLLLALPTSGEDELLVMGEEGTYLRYPEREVPLTHIRSGGVMAGKFKGRPLAALLAFHPEEKNRKFVLITDGGHLRVCSLDRFEEGHRTGAAKMMYPTFKGSPQRLLFADKCLGKMTPFSYDGVILEDKSRIDLTFEDFLLTDYQSYARPAEGFGKKRHVGAVSLENGEYVDEAFLAHPAPIGEEAPPKEEEEDGEISLLDELE